MVAKTQSRGSSSEIVWDFKLTYLHTTVLKFLEIVYFDFYEKLQDFSYKALPKCVASLLARGTIITSVGKVWACKETDVQKIKSWLLRDTCSTELCNNRNVVFWCETWAWFGCKAEGWNIWPEISSSQWSFWAALPWASQLCPITKGS